MEEEEIDAVASFFVTQLSLKKFYIFDGIYKLCINVKRQRSVKHIRFYRNKKPVLKDQKTLPFPTVPEQYIYIIYTVF